MYTKTLLALSHLVRGLVSWHHKFCFLNTGTKPISKRGLGTVGFNVVLNAQGMPKLACARSWRCCVRVECLPGMLLTWPSVAETGPLFRQISHSKSTGMLSRALVVWH